MAFGRGLYPTGTAARMSRDTMRATRGAGIPAETIASWPKRGSDPSGPHIDILVSTYGAELVAALWSGVPGLALAVQRAREDDLVHRLAAERAETDRLLSLARGRR